MNALTKVNQETRLCVQPLPAPLEDILQRVALLRPTYSDLPLITPDERKLIPAALEAVEATLEGSTPEHISKCLGTVSFALPSRMTDMDAAARLEVYIETLGDIPPDVLGEACVEAVKTCKFFPKVAELRELSAKGMLTRRWRKYTLEWLARKHDEEWAEPVPKHDLVGPEKLAALHKRLERRFPSSRKAVAG